MDDSVISALLAAGIIDVETADILRRQQDIDVARAWAENEMTTSMQGALTAQQMRVLSIVQDTGAAPDPSFWADEDAIVYDALSPTIARIVTERAILSTIVDGGTWQFSNGNALRWAQTYYQTPGGFGAVPNLDATTRTQFSGYFEQWLNGQLGNVGLPDLITALTPVFGPTRAAAIGVTETTRIFIQAQRQAQDGNDLTYGYRWQTAADERVCPICMPRNGEVRRKSAGYSSGDDIPAHPRCRCHESRETLGSLGLLPGQAPLPTTPSSPEPAQTTTQQTPVQQAVVAGPSGRPVSSALQLPETGVIAETVRDTVATIDAIHGDGALPDLPIISGEDGMKVAGSFAYQPGGNPVEIKISKRADQMMTTTAHEIGHFLDHYGLRPVASDNPVIAASRQAVFDAFDSSAAVQRLAGLISGTETLTVTLADGRLFEGVVDARYAGYLAKQHETWARAYAQYIAVRSQHPTMLEQLAKGQGNAYPSQWADDDFAPIATAIDNLFTTLGWIE